MSNVQKFTIPKLFTKKDLEHKLHIQHRNTRHDAIDILLEYNGEIEKYNAELWKQCCTGPVWDPSGQMIQPAKVDQYKYEMNKKKFNIDVLQSLIMNMKQRKPKDGE